MASVGAAFSDVKTQFKCMKHMLMEAALVQLSDQQRIRVPFHSSQLKAPVFFFKSAEPSKENTRCNITIIITMIIIIIMAISLSL